MRILLDEQLPRQLAPYLVGHDARTVHQESWAGLKNGALLTQAEDAGFSVFLTGEGRFNPIDKQMRKAYFVDSQLNDVHIVE